MPSFSYTVTQNTIHVQGTGFSELKTYNRNFGFFIGSSESTATRVGQVTRAPGTTDVEYTYTGLSPGTTYYVYVYMATDNPDSESTYRYMDQYITTEAAPETTTLSFYASAGTDSFYMAASLNKVAYARTVKFYVDGTLAGTVNVDAGSSSTYKSLTCYFSSLSRSYSEGGSAVLSVTVEDASGTTLASSSKTVYIPYDTSLSLMAGTATETSVTLQAYNIGANKSYSRILKWYRKGPEDSDYTQVSATEIPAYSASTSFNLAQNGLKANSSYSFRVDMEGAGQTLATQTVTVITKEAAGTLSVDNIGESAVTLILSGMTDAIGRTIKWYYKVSTDTAYTLAGTTDMTSSASSISKVVSGLVNETTYNFKAEIYDADDTDYIIGIKTAVAATQRQVAVMTLGSATSVSLRVNLTDMETNVNYDKYIYWYIKRSTDANYAASGCDIVTADAGASSVSRLFAGLIASTMNQDGTLNEAKYDVRAVIKKNDATTMATLNGTYATTLRESDIPQPTITEALQIVGDKQLELWWEAPEHVASSEAYVHYDIEISTDGTTFSKVKTVDLPPASYSDVTVSAFDVKYYLRVKAYPNGSSTEYKLSNVVNITLTEDFDWETVVQGGPCIVKADKWNLLIRYIRKRLSDHSITEPYELTRAKTGQPITAYAFNQLVTACDVFYATGITTKQTGDAIGAEDLLILQEAVNSKE